jgi:hypothetical protein
MADKLTATLAENLITLLAYDDKQGKIVANMIDPNLMEGDYRLVAERCIDYWRQYKEPPRDHTADLFAEIIEDKANRRANSIKRILTNMRQLAEGINTEYVMNQLRVHNRMQRIKGAIIESADKINNDAQMAIADIEEIWNNILRTQEIDFDPGINPIEHLDQIIERLETTESEFVTGVPDLDRNHVIPARGQLMVLLAAAGRGKTWGLVHVGKNALMMRKKVLHITLEVDDALIAQRYYQAMFGATKRTEEVEVTEMKTNLGELEELVRKEATPAFSWDSSMLRDDLRAHMEHVGVRRFQNLVIKRFPPNALTMNGLRAFLDTLEITTGFIPDMVILDYAALMKQDSRNLRGSIGQTVVDFRGLSIERNFAGVTAHQGSKEGEKAALMTGTHVAEDWSIVGTADVLITYSVTDREFNHGLARLYVAKSRSERDRFAVLITQSYPMGQFCIESHMMPRDYHDKLADLVGDEDDTEGEDGE